ncbi:MAG: 3-isopropylmalate dehydratase small subunit [Slackia piriformis]|uniref:3-isopropylmalate dehydratase small subunit n=1 Tax=Slackia piriformis TaxID=626934 RepID=A0A943UYR8_9ACTN|nr:3-isopropylmalate dehydratase small subunit [Slackia piriformis]
MEKFITHTGIGVPLRRSNVDTDQIIPAVYLKRVTRTGFEDALFAAWRGDPDFVLNQDAYKNGSVLIAGPDFGTGSSREHAVWALKDYGFRVVLAPKFADIFRGNSGKQGLVTGIISQEDCESLWKLLEAEPGTEVTVACDAIVNGADMLPDSSLKDATSVAETYVIGDAAEPFNIAMAIRGGNDVGRAL